MTAALSCATIIKRLAGLADVVGALLAAIEIMEPASQPEALETCATLASDIADGLDKLTRTKE
ncbi:hypothetical protein AKG95_06895 [Janthinobacterium lividum]|uniref:Uncharacterized protein n=1 Tax=Janthinobacterium lividum TaxID=29581 RepID=A0A1S1U9D5_9BURK|nr:hypothetical protein [Janthinobacterium lividum]OHV97030.1 hypothetical protein AKG95_06895 [Janthinobacterium lividum]